MANENKRLFVAIDLPETVKTELGKMQVSLGFSVRAKWVGSTELHLTLFFLGETTKTTEVARALSEIKWSPFEMVLESVGSFPPVSSGSPPRVLWAGIQQPNLALSSLHDQVAKQVVELGFPAEKHPFAHHLTLARLYIDRHTLAAVEPWVAAHKAFKTTVPVQAFHLYSSVLGPRGPTYTKEASFMPSKIVE